MTEAAVLQFEVIEQLTVPFLVMENDKDYFIRFLTAIEPDKTSFSDRVRRNRKDGQEQPSQEPIHIALVTDLQTNQKMKLVAHAVLESNLNEARPNGEYVNKTFRISKSKATGKRYFNFNITEIRLKTDTPVKGKAA